MFYNKTQYKSQSSKKGITIMEMIVAATILTIVGTFSFNQARDFNKKLNRKEAKIQLAMYYKAQSRYFFDHSEYASDISDIFHPEGPQIYNLGIDSETTYSLCGTSFSSSSSAPRVQCAFHCLPGGTSATSVGGTQPTTIRHAFKAYAIADLRDIKNCSTTSPADLDKWSINSNGTIEHIDDPFD